MSDETYQRIEVQLKREVEDKKQYLNPQLSLTALARLIATNRTYMSAYFRVQHTTFWLYINRLRCRYAKQLLDEHPDMDYAELALHCGYKTDNSLRTAFRYFYGMTPVAYVHSARGENTQK